MTRQGAFELRILSGIHAGARALLERDAYTLGTLADECDFVLDDAGVAPRHATISRREDGWGIDWAANDDGAPAFAAVVVETGKAVPLGPIVVAIDSPDAPWPTLEQLVLVPHAPYAEAELPQPVEPVITKPSEEAQPSARPKVKFAAAALAVGMPVLAFVAWPMGLVGSRVPEFAGDADAVSAAAPDAAQAQAIRAQLARLGLADRSLVERSAAVWRIRTITSSDSEAESLLSAVGRMEPKPQLRITPFDDLKEQVADIAAGMASGARPVLTVRDAGGGHFRVEGRISPTFERAKFLQAVAKAFPQVRAWDDGLVGARDDADQLAAELRAAGWDVTGRWNDGTYEMEVPVAAGDVSRWERDLRSVAAQHPVTFRANVVAAPAQARADSGESRRVNAEVKLPFEIRSVVGGEMPYVLLADGAKLSRGGVERGWRLTGITSSQVVFENGARRAAVAR